MEKLIADKRIMEYRVDTIPWLFRPVYLGVALVLGSLLYLYYLFCRITSHISIEGPGSHDLSRHSIYCMWHESWWSYFVVFHRFRRSQVMISHPAAYMKPLHYVFQLMGLKYLLLGSSGEEGRKAVDNLAALVRNGLSTTISPDGPSGPRRTLKKGVLHLALQTGVPIVPITVTALRVIAFPSWDCKRHPLPFNQIQVTVHETIFVDGRNFHEVSTQIVYALGTPENDAAIRTEDSGTVRFSLSSPAAPCSPHQISLVAPSLR